VKKNNAPSTDPILEEKQAIRNQNKMHFRVCKHTYIARSIRWLIGMELGKRKDVFDVLNYRRGSLCFVLFSPPIPLL